MKNLITAEEAKKLAGATVKEQVEAIFPFIRKAAEEKKRILRTGWEYKDDTELWIGGGYSKSPEWMEAKKILEELGYIVGFYYKEGQLAVDMYTTIEW